jgi:hypothetical protein
MNNKMKTTIAFVGLTLVLLSSYLYVYNRGLVDGKYKYQHSHNLQLTLDCAYSYGLQDGEALGYYEGLIYGKQMCDKQNKKIRYLKHKRLDK